MDNARKKLIYLVLVFLFVVIYDRWSPPVAVAPSEVKGEKIGEKFMVEKIVDGDTIKLSNGKTVRYIGIDTPETVHPNKEVQCYGKESSEFNKGLVLGRTVTLVKDVSETDRYGRLLRYVYLEDGTFVNEEMVNKGYAYASSYPPDILFSKDLATAMAEARDKKRGLWAACPTL